MTCAVCLLALDEAEGVATVQTACKHRFHLGCLLRCLEHRNTSCPMCRQIIDVELTAAPRPWMALANNPPHRRSALLSVATTEAAVAVEIAESVRLALSEDESRRASARRSPEAAATRSGIDQRNEDARDVFFLGSAALAAVMEDETHRVPGLLSAESATAQRRSGFRSGITDRGHANRTSWNISDELAWYGEIAEEVAVSMASEGQLAQGPVADAAELEVDPDALAGLRETVLHIHDTNMLTMRPGRPLQQRPPQGCRSVSESSRYSGNLGINFSDRDIVSIARAVLRSLDEDSAHA